jgi:hypothetical protein
MHNERIIRKEVNLLIILATALSACLNHSETGKLFCIGSFVNIDFNRSPNKIVGVQGVDFMLHNKVNKVIKARNHFHYAAIWKSVVVEIDRSFASVNRQMSLLPVKKVAGRKLIKKGDVIKRGRDILECGKYEKK